MPSTANREWKSVEDQVTFDSLHQNTQLHANDMPEPQLISRPQAPFSCDYVNALALSDAGEALIFERGNLGGMSSWQVVGGYVQEGEDPMMAVQRTLLEETGYHSENWLYLGSYMMSNGNEQETVGHFFCAQDAEEVASPKPAENHDREIRWVSQRDLRYALLDGRISVLNYAITISMALLTVLD
jgi:8-oxo-dGTP pyrophosphatase MutT (NUDIX family)